MAIDGILALASRSAVPAENVREAAAEHNEEKAETKPEVFEAESQVQEEGKGQRLNLSV